MLHGVLSTSQNKGFNPVFITIILCVFYFGSNVILKIALILFGNPEAEISLKKINIIQRTENSYYIRYTDLIRNLIYKINGQQIFGIFFKRRKN